MNHRVPLSRCFGKPLVKGSIKSNAPRKIKPLRICSCGLRHKSCLFEELGRSTKTSNSTFVTDTDIPFANLKNKPAGKCIVKIPIVKMPRLDVTV